MVTNSPSVQIMFNGPGFDPKWMLSKAERELGITMKNHNDFMENAANLAVTIAHLADWVFVMKPESFPGATKPIDIQKQVHIECPKAALFFDICNEYKHADRKWKSTATAQVLLYCESYAKDSDLSQMRDSNRMFAMGTNAQYVFVPKIKDTSGNEHFFAECAREAIEWWRSIIN